MTETIRYSLIGKEDLKLEPRNGSFEVTLADGRVVVMSAVDIAYLLSDAYDLGSLPAAGVAGRLARVKNDTRGIRRDTGAIWTGAVADVQDFVTAGAGTSGSPWTGWETAINALPANVAVYFRYGYYRVSTNLLVKSGWLVYGDGPDRSILVFAPGIALGTKMIKNADQTNGNTRLTICDLTLDGNRSSNSGIPSLTAIEWQKVTFSRIERVRMTGFTQHCVDASVENSDNWIVFNECDDYGTGATGFGIVILSDGHRNKIIANRVRSTLANIGIGIDDQSGAIGGVASTQNVIALNSIQGTDTAIVVAGSHRNVIVANPIKSPTNIGINIGPSTDALNDAIENIVDGNPIDIDASVNAFGILIRGTGTRATNNTINRGQHGIVVDDVTGFTTADTYIAGNRVASQSAHGIALRGGVRTMAKDNTSRAAGDTGIDVDTTTATGTMRVIVLSGNLVSTPQNEGISVTSGASVAIQEVTIEDNCLVDVSQAASGSRSAVFLSKGAAALDRITVRGTRSIVTGAIVPARLVETAGSPTSVDVSDNRPWGWTPSTTSDGESGNPVLKHVSATAVLDFDLTASASQDLTPP